jgi:hypothetical protein
MDRALLMISGAPNGQMLVILVIQAGKGDCHASIRLGLPVMIGVGGNARLIASAACARRMDAKNSRFE